GPPREDKRSTRKMIEARWRKPAGGGPPAARAPAARGGGVGAPQAEPGPPPARRHPEHDRCSGPAAPRVDGHRSERSAAPRRAVRLTEGDPVVREHLGDVYVDLRLPDLAREQYRLGAAAEGENAKRVGDKLRALR